MTGWRLGYLAAPLEIAKACDMRIQSQFTSATAQSPNAVPSRLCAESLILPERWWQYLRERRAFIYNALKAIPGPVK